MSLIDRLKYYKAKTERGTILHLRQAWWVIFSGWFMFAFWALSGILWCLTIIGIPIGIQILRFSLFALCPVGYEVTRYPQEVEKKHILKNPFHPVTVFCNVVWLVVFGWGMFLLFLFTAVIQAITIFGIFNAMTSLRMAMFSLWPIGRRVSKVIPGPLPPKHGVATETTAPVAPVVGTYGASTAHPVHDHPEVIHHTVATAPVNAPVHHAPVHTHHVPAPAPVSGYPVQKVPYAVGEVPQSGPFSTVHV